MPELKKHFSGIDETNKRSVLSPDVGSNKLGQAYAKQLGFGFAVIDKRRGAHNKSEVAYLVGDISSRHVLIIDDMIDTAGTICNAAKGAKEKGALSVTIAATHGILSGDALDKLSDNTIDKIFISDTVAISKEKKIEK